MSASKNGRNITVKGLELRIDMIVEAIATLIPANATLNLDGKTLTQADALKAARAIQAVYKARRDLRNALAEKNLEIETTTKDEARRFVNSAFHMAASALGASSHDLRQFGFSPRTPARKLTAEEKAVRAEKARRTREARHTLGSRQKEAIRGDAVTPTSSSPGTRTPATAAPATPAPATAPDSNRKAV